MHEGDSTFSENDSSIIVTSPSFLTNHSSNSTGKYSSHVSHHHRRHLHHSQYFPVAFPPVIITSVNLNVNSNVPFPTSLNIVTSSSYLSWNEKGFICNNNVNSSFCKLIKSASTSTPPCPTCSGLMSHTENDFEERSQIYCCWWTFIFYLNRNWSLKL